jgi:hypothetical protein
LRALFGQPSSEGALARGAAAGLASVGVVDLVQHFLNNPADKTTPAGHHARYAIVDTHNNTVITFLGPHRLYRFLVKPRSKSRRTKIVVVRDGSSQTITR